MFNSKIFIILDSGILLWQYSDKDVAPDLFGEDAEMGADGAEEDQTPVRRENWVIFRTLRGHLQDVVDISWYVSCGGENKTDINNTF